MILSETLKAYQNQKWVIAVSGGPDSMALLDLARQSKAQCFCVHVNYHLRETADRDMMIVKDYCSTHKIPLFIFDSPKGSGNFQDFARRFRYEKFAEVAQENSALGVLVAHHLLDDLETYVMQKQRRSQVTHYGLQSKTTLFGITVERPLLELKKEDLIEYCEENKIVYGIDESNTSDDYLRNRIRKELLALPGHYALCDLLEEKHKDNEDLEAYQAKHQKQLTKKSIMVSDFLCLEYPVLFLQLWIRTHCDLKSLSEDHLSELNRQLRTSASLTQKLGSWRLIKQYGQISLLSSPPSYTVILKGPEDVKTEFFEIKTQAEEKHGFVVYDSDYPISIRNAQKGETYLRHGELHKLSRWFISHKIPQSERECWPVVVNCKNEVIHIARLRLDRQLYTSKTKLYMIK